MITHREGKKRKLGFIGAGFIARFQSVAISQVRGLEIAGILKRRGAEALAGYYRENRLGDAKIYGSISELASNVDPGYAFEINTLVSPLTVFIGDVAADAIANQESALKKATASRGLLAVQYNEADLYGYTDENRDMLDPSHRDTMPMLSWEYGLEIQRLVMASYLSAERGKTIDLTDKTTMAELRFVHSRDPARQRSGAIATPWIGGS